MTSRLGMGKSLTFFLQCTSKCDNPPVQVFPSPCIPGGHTPHSKSSSTALLSPSSPDVMARHATPGKQGLGRQGSGAVQSRPSPRSPGGHGPQWLRPAGRSAVQVTPGLQGEGEQGSVRVQVIPSPTWATKGDLKRRHHKNKLRNRYQ